MTPAHHGHSAVTSLRAGSGVGEQDRALIGAEEKVINSKNKVDENMVSRFFLLPCPVLRVSGIVFDAFWMNLDVFVFHMVEGG